MKLYVDCGKRGNFVAHQFESIEVSNGVVHIRISEKRCHSFSLCDIKSFEVTR